MRRELQVRRLNTENHLCSRCATRVWCQATQNTDWGADNATGKKLRGEYTYECALDYRLKTEVYMCVRSCSSEEVQFTEQVDCHMCATCAAIAW